MEHGYQPWSILALTFTNKAADEMKDRIAQIVGKDYAKMLLWMGTFHRMFLHILQREHEKIGFSSNFTIYDTTDSKNLIKDIIKKMKKVKPLENFDNYKPSLVLSTISNAKNQLITAEQYVANPANRQRDHYHNMEELGQIFLRYSNRCRQNNAMDFDDILLYTYLLFEQHPDVLEKWAQQFRYVLVDEYQDTNFAQHRIVWQLTRQHQHVCVVGDDAQSIYSFRGATIDNIFAFQKIYDGALLFKLEQNYRSTQNIVEAANSLIKKNSRQIMKDVFSENDRGEKLHVINTQSDVEEAKMVTNTIRAIKRREGCEYSDFAVLYRTNAQSRVFEDTLRKEAMPYRVYGGLSFYQHKEIKDILAYFRLAVNPNDEEAFKRVINYPARGIGQTTMSKIQDVATSNEVSLWTVIGAPECYGLDVNKGTLGKIAQFKQLIDGFIEQARTLPANQLGMLIMEQSGIKADIYQNSTPENLSRQENVEELINGMQDFYDMRREEGNEKILLSDYISEASLMSDVDRDEHKICLMTIHSAKGLEFGTVFVVGLEEGLFPSDMVSGNPREMEEERRLFYVAITRAKTHCYLSYAQCRFRYGQMEFSAPSRFLKDIDSKYLDRQQSMFSTRRSIDDDVQLPWARKGGQSAQPRPFRPTIPSPSVRPMSVGGSQGTSMRRATSSSDGNKTLSPVSQTTGASHGLPAHHSGGALKEGSYILHNRFGRGQVLRIEGTGDSTKATVQFENVGTKQLLLKFAKFEVMG